MPGQVGIFITKFITKESCVRHRDVIFKQRFKETYMTNQKQKTPNKTWYNGGCCSWDHVSYIDNSENRINFLYGVTSSETNLDNEQKDYMILEHRMEKKVPSCGLIKIKQ